MRRIQQRLTGDVGLWVLAVGNAPDFRTISYFRPIPPAMLGSLFDQVLKILPEMDAMKQGGAAGDGTAGRESACHTDFAPNRSSGRKIGRRSVSLLYDGSV